MKKLLSIILTFFSVSFLFAERINLQSDPYFRLMKIPGSLYKSIVSGSAKVGEKREDKAIADSRENLKMARTAQKFLLDVDRTKVSDYIKTTSAVLNAGASRKTLMTYDTILETLKTKTEFEGPEGASQTCNIMSWSTFGVTDVSKQYSNTAKADGCGVYLICVYTKEYVYTFRLSDTLDCERENKTFDALSQYVTFQKGTATNIDKGIEGTQGYYFISADLQKQFYYDMVGPTSTLPAYVTNFQKAYLDLLKAVEECATKIN